MKRKRDLLYDAFGRSTLAPQPSAMPVPAARKAVRPKELRLRGDVAIVLGLVAVVLVGTSYYFGTLGKNQDGKKAVLSTRHRVAPDQLGAERRPAEPEGVEPFWAIQVLTSKWGGPKSRSDVENYVIEACKYLEKQGFKDVVPVRDVSKQQIVVYAGRSETPLSLEAMLGRLRKLRFGNHSFQDAIIYKIDFPID